MSTQKSKHVVWHSSLVSPDDRRQLLGHGATTVWLTGLSASGKSTLAFSLERALISQARLCYVLDGDNVRHGLNSNLGFSAEDRMENIRRIAEVAKLMNSAGIIVIAAFISPFEKDRQMARTIIGDNYFREVHVSTALEVCEARDPKGMYRRARAGELKNFTGIGSMYEEPINPDLRLDTSALTLVDATEILVSLISRHTGQFSS